MICSVARTWCSNRLVLNDRPEKIDMYVLLGCSAALAMKYEHGVAQRFAVWRQQSQYEYKLFLSDAS